MNSAQKSFFTWLRKSDPFVYDVVTKKLKDDGVQLQAWGSILSAVGSAVGTIAPAYLGYKASKDNKKLEKERLKYEREQANKDREERAADRVRTQLPVQTSPYRTTVNQPAQSLPPAPNVESINEILKRLTIAAQNKQQPAATNSYVPFVQPRAVPNYQQAVRETASPPWYKQIPPTVLAVGAAIAFKLLN